MDLSMIKPMLDSLERAYKSATDMVVKQMNDHIDKLERKVSGKKKFTQYEVDELKSNIKEHKRERKDAK